MPFNRVDRLLLDRFDVDRDVDLYAYSGLAAKDAPFGAIDLCGGFPAGKLCPLHAWAET